MRTSLAGISLIAVLLVSGCGSSATSSAGPTTTPVPTATPAPTAASTPTATAAPTAKPTPIPTPTPAATPSIAWVELEPASVVDTPGSSGFRPVFRNGEDLWVVARNAFLKINPQTEAIEQLDAPVMPDDASIALTEDGLWVASWGGDQLHKLDPQTGEVLLEAALDNPVNFQLVGDDLWIGSESKQAMFRIDRSTGEIDTSSEVEGSAYAAYGMGDFWFMSGTQVRRVDPQTKEVVATIYVADKANCARDVGGRFPDGVWTSCFEREAREQSIARIDPTTNTIAQVVTLPDSVGGRFVQIGDDTWYVGVFEDADHSAFSGLIRMDQATGVMDRFYALPGADLDATAISFGDAVWIPDEGGNMLKFNIADLNG